MRNQRQWVRIVIWVVVVMMVLSLFATVALVAGG